MRSQLHLIFRIADHRVTPNFIPIGFLPASNLPTLRPAAFYHHATITTSTAAKRPTPRTMSSPAGTKRDAGHLKSPATDSKKTKTSSITSFFGAPKAKPTNANAKPASVVPSNFNKQKWVDSLTLEQRTLLQLEIDTMDESWLARLKEELVTPEFLELKRFLKKEKDSGVKIFPPENEIYSWYCAFPVCYFGEHLLTRVQDPAYTLEQR